MEGEIKLNKGPENKNVITPNYTLYINNLNEKIKVDGIYFFNLELKQCLYQLFSQFGDILEIHARKSFKMKGQAFIVFRDINSATTAKHSLDNAPMFGKNMRVSFAKNTSDTISKLTGSFSQKDKVKRDMERRKRREEEYQQIIKKQKEKGTGGQIAKEKKEIKENVQSKQQQSQLLTPNNILFIDNLTSDITEPILRTIFSKYNGFKEVRLYPGKGIAFVEYDTEINAGAALLGLNNYALTNDCILHITFAKK